MMDCKKFEEYIDDYFTDPDLHWKIREEIDDHYFSCKKCFETYQIAKLMADDGLKKETIKELQMSESDNIMDKAYQQALEDLEQLPKEERDYRYKPLDPNLLDFKVVQERCEEVLEKDPGNRSARSMLARLQRTTGKPVEDIPAEYIDAVVEPLIKIAEKEYGENQNFERAAELYTEAHLWRPNDIEIKKMFGVMKYQSGSYNDAIEILEEVKEVLKSDPEVFTTLGDAYRELKDYHMALSTYEKAYELGHEPFVLSHTGMQHAKLGDLEKGKEIVEKAYSLNRNDILIWNDKGIIHMMAGEFSEAVVILEKCVTLTECIKKTRNISTAYSNLAMAYYETGKVDNAKQYINAAIKLNPDHETIKHNYEIITGMSEGDLLMLI